MTGLALAAICSATAAQNYPARTVRMVVGYPPGGAEPVGMPPEEIGKVLHREIEK